MIASALLGVAGFGIHKRKLQKKLVEKGGDPRESGPVYARNRTADVAHIGLGKRTQPVLRAPPPEMRYVKMRQPLTKEAAQRIQHVLAITARPAPPFFEPKSQSINRQIYYNTLPRYHPGFTRVEVTHSGSSAKPMPVAPIHAIA